MGIETFKQVPVTRCDLGLLLQHAPQRHLPLFCQIPSDVKIKCVEEEKETDWSVPNMCGRHRSVSASRQSIHQEDRFN